jgi:polyketide cyclase/dehydrase/lipid transport protein
MPSSITMTLTFSTSAPPAAVWAALEAAPRWPEVLDDITEARIEPDGKLAVGAVMRSFAKPGSDAADMAYRVVAAKRPRHLAIEAMVGNFRSRAEYAIEGSDGGATVTLAAAIEPTRAVDKVILALARKRYLGQFKAGLQKRMRALLTLAERIAQAEGAGGNRRTDSKP